MADAPVTLRSNFWYQLYLMLAIIVGVIVHVDISRYTLIYLESDPLLWIMESLLALGTIMIPIVPMIWFMRQRIDYREPTWNSRLREVSMDEYRKMFKEYRRQYVHIIAQLDPLYLMLSLISGALVIASPFILTSMSPYLIQYGPYLFGFCLLGFALFTTRFFYSLFPTKASERFSILSPRLIKHGVDLLSRSAGISWWGVRVNIGESGGFFIIKEVMPVGRIAGIESEAVIAIGMVSGRIVQVSAMVQWNGEEFSVDVTTSPDDSLRHLVLQVLYSYVVSTDDKEGVSETLYDLGFSSTDAFMDSMNGA